MSTAIAQSDVRSILASFRTGINCPIRCTRILRCSLGDHDDADVLRLHVHVGHDAALGPRWAWLPGTLFGVLGGLWGGVSGCLAPRGRARKLVMAWGLVLLAACAGMLLLALALLMMGHPRLLWYPWLLPGAIGIVVFGPLIRTVRLRYQQAEMRRLEAKDISSKPF